MMTTFLWLAVGFILLALFVGTVALERNAKGTDL